MWLLLYLVLVLANSPFSTATSTGNDQAIVSFAEDIPPLMKTSLTTANGTGLVRGMRSTYDADDGFWASAPVQRLDSREQPLGPFWPNRGRREMEELLEAIYASIGSKQGKESLGDASPRPSRDGFPTPFDELRSMMRLTPHESGFFGSLLKNKVKLPKTPTKDHETATNRSYPDDNDDDDDDDEGIEVASDRGRRKTSKEAPDPFLANRGRATDEEDQVVVNMVRGADDTETFWPNRGREVVDQENFWPNRGREVGDPETFWPNRGREVGDQDIFYPNRGREAGDVGPFYPNRGREAGDPDPFYPNRGREVEEDGTFYPNRGRGLKDEDFWPNRGRELQATANPFWPNRGRDADDVPYWAKRARSLGGVVSFANSDDPGSVVASALKQRVRMRDVLYAELPTWIPLERRQAGLTGIAASKADPFWISRGRRADAEDTRLRRGLKNSLTREETFYPARGRRGLRETLSAEEQFWPLRGRRGLKETLSTEEHFWPLRGRRGLKDSLSAEENFWPVRGRRGLRESLAKDEHFWPVRGRRDGLRSLPKEELFWPVRGKKNEEQVWRGRRMPTESTAARALGNLQDPNFWPVRGKRPRDTDNEEDAAFWAALEKRSAAKKELAAKATKEGVQGN